MRYLDQLRLMAAYNIWMNDKVYDAAARLSPEDLAADRGAFFGSILGTLNHLCVTDMMWVHRFRDFPAASPALASVLALQKPTRLDQRLEDDLGRLRALRATLDRALADFVAAVADDDLDTAFSYTRANGERQRKTLGPILGHLFNHQTHHRGQITTLLSQAGQDVGVTDLLALIPAAD